MKKTPKRFTAHEIAQALEKCGTMRGAWQELGRKGKPSGCFKRRCLRIRPTLRGPISGTISPAVPSGYYPHAITTRTGPDGEVVGQSIDARVAPDASAVEHVIPFGHVVSGVSSFLGPDGTVQHQWVKTRADNDRLDTLVARLREVLVNDVVGKANPVPAPEISNDDLLAVFPIGDPHIGMLSWHPETGEDFDLKIASANMRNCFAQLCSVTRPAKKALILQLGDFFHTDNATNRTSRSGNALDVDGRWAKVLDVGIQLMRDCIDLALERFGQVTVENLIGNHDDCTSIVLSHVLSAFYEREPRVTISKSPNPFRYHRHGRCIIGATHGDGAKPPHLAEIMAHDCAGWWGEKQHRRWYVGHVHHDRVMELRTCTVESVRTLAGRDAWHHREGYRSDRDMKCDLWHREHGLIQRFIVGIEQIRSP